MFGAEYDGLLPQESEEAKNLDLPGIFGATEDDTAKLRIVSLVAVTHPHSIFSSCLLAVAASAIN
jgi:hypothetical protein